MSVPNTFTNVSSATGAQLDANFAACAQLNANNTLTGTLNASGTVNAAGIVNLSNSLNYAPTVTIASASSVAIGAAASNNITISGTATVTSFDTIAEGAIRHVTYSGAVPITYNVTSMQLVGGVSRTNAVGDVSIFRSLGSGNWVEEFYQPIIGYQKVGSLSGTSTTKLPTIGCTQATGDLTFSASSIYLDFRSTTATDGTISTINASPSNLVLPSGGTLNAVSTVSARIVVVELNNAGTAELAIVNIAGGNDLSETGVISTTAISASSTANNVFYSTTARTNVAYRVVGIVDVVNTAGAWGNPTLVQGAGGQALTAMSSAGYGQTWQNLSGSRALAVTYYNQTGKMIGVNTTCLSTNSAAAYIDSTQNGVTTRVYGASAVAGIGIAVYAEIPPGAAYSSGATAGSTSGMIWNERR